MQFVDSRDLEVGFSLFAVLFDFPQAFFLLFVELERGADHLVPLLMEALLGEAVPLLPKQ